MNNSEQKSIYEADLPAVHREIEGNEGKQTPTEKIELWLCKYDCMQMETKSDRRGASPSAEPNSAD